MEDGKKFDVRVEDHGSIVQLFLDTDAAREWVSEHVVAESWCFMGSSLLVEHRFASDIVAGMVDDGLAVTHA